MGLGVEFGQGTIPFCSCGGSVLLPLQVHLEPVEQVEPSDLKLVPPIAGAFWTPKQPPTYDKSLPVYTVVYSEEEKAAQRAAYAKHLQGLKDALAAGERCYTFPPGIYRSREKIHMEVGFL